MSIPSFSLEGKVAIVTGGGTGIGRSIALAFAEAGADVVVCSRKLTNLEKVAEEIRTLGRHALAVQAGIARKAGVDNMVQRVWDAVLNTNLKGYYLYSQAVGRRMIDRKKGNIINIASRIAMMVAYWLSPCPMPRLELVPMRGC